MSGQSKQLMDGERIRSFLAKEIKAVVATYKQFEDLVPHPTRSGSGHPGEDGRYVESLIRSCLRKFLPRDLEVGSGFILRPAVKTGTDGQERRGEEDQVSSQLDILVFDGAHYPSFQRFDDAVIVPPEGVVGVISVKKTLRPADISAECMNLHDAAQLCRNLDSDNEPRRGPFLALIGMDYPEDLQAKAGSKERLFSKIESAYKLNPKPYFDELVSFVGVMRRGGVFKQRPRKNNIEKAIFLWHNYSENEEHLALQFLITGILSVYYDPTRGALRRPGFTAFPSGRLVDKELGTVPVSGLRCAR